MKRNLNEVVPFIPSEHGEKRRMERKISVRDLQRAVKYGTKEKSCHPTTKEFRWKYTYNDIVYVTDESSTKEVTSWSLVILSLFPAIIPTNLQDQHLEAKRRLLANPGIITSHTVLVLDQSGSMKQSDLLGHRSRLHGVLYTVADVLVASQLHPISAGRFGGNHVGHTDVVTIVNMSTVATKVFELEPFSWILYNKIVELWGRSRPRGHGVFEAAVDLALDA